jgi:hypothetical protein
MPWEPAYDSTSNPSAREPPSPELKWAWLTFDDESTPYRWAGFHPRQDT